MNKVQFIGRLTADPELRYTNSNIAVGNFNIAVDRQFRDNEGNSTTDFFRCTIWRKLAENMKQYTQKGSLVYIEGEVHNEKYQDKEGNNRISTDISVERVKFLSRIENTKEDTTPYDYQEPTEAPTEDPFADFGNGIEINDDDLPF